MMERLLEALKGEHGDYVRVTGEHPKNCSVCALIDECRHRLAVWDKDGAES